MSKHHDEDDELDPRKMAEDTEEKLASDLAEFESLFGADDKRHRKDKPS